MRKRSNLYLDGPSLEFTTFMTLPNVMILLSNLRNSSINSRKGVGSQKNVAYESIAYY